MPHEVYAEEDHYRIEYHDDIDVIVHYWTDFSTGQKFRDGSNELLEFIKSRDTSKMIVDTSGIQAHDEEDRKWLEEVWVPKTTDAGIDNSAVVHPDSVIAEMEMEEFAEDIEGLGLTQYNTSSMEDAKEWLADK